MLCSDDLLIECKKEPWFYQDSFESCFSESLSRPTLAPSTWNVTIIESCVSDNNNWYRPEVLQESMGVFEGAPCRIYFFDGRTRKDGNWSSFHNDHMPGWLAARDSGHVTGNTVGQFHDVDFKTVPSRRFPGRMNEAVVAKVTLIDPITRVRLYEAWQQGLIKPTARSLFELSIEASGPHRPAFTESGRQVRMVELIQSCKEVTIVSDGAAGGGFTSPCLSMSESSEYSEKNGEEITEEDIQNFSESISNRMFSQEFIESTEDENDFPENTLSESYLRKLGISSKDDPGAALSGPNHSMDDDLNEQTEDDPSGKFQNDLFPKFGEDDISQIEKAKDVLRSGNQSMGIEILEKILEKRSKNGVMDKNVGPERMFVKRESKTAKEPTRMRTREIEESEDMGSDYSESYGARDIEDFVRSMAIHNAQRDAQMAQLQESYALVGNVIERQQRYLRESAVNAELRECEQILQNRLRESGLPIETQTLIAEQYSGRRFKEASLINTINKHCRHLENIVGKVENNLREANPNVSYYDPYSSSQGASMSYSRNTRAGHNPFDVVQAEFDRAFGYDFNLDSNLSESQRELYRNLPNTPSIKRPMGVWHGDMDYQFNGEIGRDALLREAAASTDSGLTYLLQNSMTKSVMQRFMILPAEYREVCEIVPAANFLEHQVVVTGGLGYLPQVVESKTGVSYLTLGFPSTFQTKYTVGTFGGLISVTRQAIVNDNLQEIQQYPKDAAESAMMTLNRNVFGTLFGMYGQGGNGNINSALSYDGVPYYHANHLNVTTDAMGYSSLTDMQDRLFEQRNFGNTTTLHANITGGDLTFEVTANKNDFVNGIKAGDSIQIEAEIREVASVNTSTNVITVTEAFSASHTAGPDTLPVFQLSTPIAFNKRTLIVPTQLSHKAYQLLASTLEPGTTTNSASALNPSFRDGSLRLMRLHSMYMKNDRNNYYMVAGKPVRWAFLGGRETPEIMLKDNPLVDNVFSGDLISWKVRHEHGGVLMSHLPVQAGIVSA